VREQGARLSEGLSQLPSVREVRGRGLMLGVGLADGLVAGEVNATLLERGLIANAPETNTIRLLPPLVIGAEEVERALEVFASLS
jgi:acetylornithine/N-succinyldiaminopimelate aminotransferase